MDMKLVVLLCILASLLYSAELIGTDRYLDKTSPIITTFFLGVFIALFAAPAALEGLRNGSVNLPSYKEIAIIAAVAICSFLADWSHFAALHYKAGTVELAMFYLLIPVICSVIEMRIPSMNMIVAWILGGAALLIVSFELAKIKAQNG